MDTLTQKIELYKVRTFGDMLSDTFNFVRQNFKPLFKGLFYIVSPALLLMAIFWAYSYQILGGSSSFDLTDPYLTGYLTGKMLPVYLFMFIGTTLLMSVTFSYVKLYAEDKEREISVSMLWQVAKKYFWKLVGLQVILGIGAGIIIAVPVAGLIVALSTNSVVGIFLTFLLFLAIFILLIFFFIKIYFSPLLIVVKDKGIFGAISESWSFTKGIFWKTFGFTLVLGLLVGIISYIFLLPGYLVMIIGMITGFAGNEGDMALLSGVLLALGLAVATLMYSVTFTGQGIIYFSEIEKREGINLQKQIDEIGKKEE
jgi:hypothetical protein